MGTGPARLEVIHMEPKADFTCEATVRPATLGTDEMSRYDKGRMALIVEHAAAAAKRARQKLGPQDNALQVLGNEVRGDPLALEGLMLALSSEVAEPDNEISRVEFWVRAMKATRH